MLYTTYVTVSRKLLLCSIAFVLTAGAGADARIGNAQTNGAQSATTEDSALSARLIQVNHDIEAKGLHAYPGSKDKLLTGYAYGEYYDWDLYFENVYLSYYGVSKYCFSNLQMFLAKQEPDGFISRTLGIVNKRPTQMFKPFLAQLAVLGSQQNGNDYEWLRAGGYERLQKYVTRWFAYDKDGNGLPVWNSSDASGMDNQFSRSGQLESYTDEGVDLATYLVRELQAMAIISGKLNKPEEQRQYQKHATALALQINKVFWDEKDGFYYDRNEKTGKPIRIKSVAGFFPLWAGIVPPDRATRLVKEHLMNPKEFWSKYPVPSYAMDEPDFYEGTRDGECNWRGNTWIPANYMIFHGLKRYGFEKEAKALADKTQELALNRNPVTREYYESQSGAGHGMDPFWGWSALAYVMPLEDKLNYDPTDLTGSPKPIVKEQLHISF